MKQTILANARYWLRVLRAAAGDELLPEADLRSAARAIEAALAEPDMGAITWELALALHPHMEQRGHWADWSGFLQFLILRVRVQNDAKAEAELLLRRGAILRQRGDYQGAVFACRRAWKLYRWLKSKSGQARAFASLGDVYRLQGQFWRAEVLCRAALVQFGNEDCLPERARTENALALIHFDQGRYLAAIPHLERAETFNRRAGEWHGLAKVFHNLGELYRRSGDLGQALEYLEQAIHYYLQTGDEIHAARARLNIGNVYLRQGDLEQAEKTYTRAEAILLRAGDSLDLAGARHNLGIVYTRLENWNEAAACFARALEQWRSREDVWREANTLGEMTTLDLARGDLHAARTCLERAWQLASGRREPHFVRLQQELTERRKRLD
ncbi:MAG: tetratricopeptide repeat protein [Anaerolineales bacterium]|nr:tetratricopeptide repeat protein [Anaerolineales bacterium]